MPANADCAYGAGLLLIGLIAHLGNGTEPMHAARHAGPIDIDLGDDADNAFGRTQAALPR
jgi:hypothetical protein